MKHAQGRLLRPADAATIAVRRPGAPRVTRLQQMSRANKHRYHMPDGPEQQERDAAMVAQRERSPETMQWLFGFDAADVAAAG